MLINFHTLKNLSQITATIILISLYGCSTNKQPQQLALHTWQSLIRYETEVTNKIDAENAFYQSQLLNIRRGLTGFTSLSDIKVTENEKNVANFMCNINKEINRIENKKCENKIENSLLYQRIYTNAQRDARTLADLLAHSSSPKITTAIIKMIDKGINEDISYYQRIAKRDKELSENLLSNLVTLNQERKKLKQARDNLAKLSKDPDFDEKLGLLQEHGQIIAKELEQVK